MKNMLILKTRALALIMFVLMSVQAFAQENGMDINVDIDKDDNNMFAQPWVWIVGGAVFILLLVALLRGGSKK
ncbi:hypothetical protein [Sphingobacterium sp. CZ-2]|uniref:hypothetical protein n=1 Tax=Sphingobacterium sp. CZ-2 TaxID=2557994 RepID=UPI00106FDCA9|nr:hypothetical protein [Sphingobacterium sp. CZ-2]QBR12937.1 hypothetical protein E3D81_12515 [Sphingobacterium sp. CZ-2]